MFKKIGPGVLVAAAFIGPGTVTACTLAGVGFGYALLWAMLLSILATVVLQEMSARLGVVTQKGLADAIKQELKTPLLRYFMIGIVLAAIVIGNAAYEAGNIGGATLGMQALFGTSYSGFYPLIIGFLAFLLLYLGNYKTLEKVFVTLVILMSISFLMTAIITKPNISEVLKGMLIPNIPEQSLLTIIALVGTTVVPYNLFLHASLVSEKWKSKDDLPVARKDTMISIVVGGMVSMSIMVAAAAIPGNEVTNVMDLAKGLEPLYGDSAKYFMGIGLLAAGITSAITAPLAAAYVVNSCFGWKAGLKDIKFRIVWISILGLGIFFLSFGIKPIEIIKFAQVANGILLPVIAIFLLWVVNKSSVMGSFKNTKTQNILGFVIIVLAVVLGAKSIFKVIGIF
ncbi:Nramp family divalent metal transporter [Maribacter sp. HTCC2170]|uniref:Nramp family divalent metal transporter n=1 Tax=Maribacter sp. (strain HTCC2170 / KCCM 42371) TaxID=313603 RepID=UPI00006AFCE2|nr:Nramp family divalent metal transporter [Maribacter sp. HTCC2170]EAR01516.1 Mn2+/Fe2+ transporter, NRAMP family protein [Maribacter sp. HTCC2170]